MKNSKKPKPVARLETRRVELVRSIYQPSTADLAESISLPPMLPEDAACRLMEPVEIHHKDKPRRES